MSGVFPKRSTQTRAAFTSSRRFAPVTVSSGLPEALPPRVFGSPLQAAPGAKRRELVKAARVWVDRFGKPPDIYRFDCIAIVDGKLEHLADAFRPGWR